MSPVYYQDPANYYAQENQRRDEQMRNLLNMVMAAKRFQYERGQDEWQRGVTERQLAETARYHDMYADRYGESRATPAAVPSSIQEAQALVDSGIAKNMGEAVLMLKSQGGSKARSIDDELTLYRGKAGIDKAAKAPSIEDKDRDYRKAIDDIHTNFANKSWGLKAQLAKDEAAVISDPFNRDKEQALAQLRAKQGDMLAQAEADRQKEIENLNSQYYDLPRVQAHIMNKKAATDKVMAGLEAPEAGVSSAAPVAPPVPKEAPKGTKFYKYDTDGVPVFAFPDGTKHRYLAE